MSAEKIIEQITKDSELRKNQILEEADQKAKEIIKNAKSEAKLQVDKILKDGEIQSEAIKKILISKANQDVKKEILNQREKIIDECFVKAHHKLSTLNEQKYIEIVTKLIKDGFNKIGMDCSILASRDLDKKIAKNLNIKVTGSIEASGGILLISADGRITLDHTFDGILKREKDRIRIKVGRLLFS